MDGSDIFFEFLASWENNAVRLYINGDTDYNSYVAQYITQDKKNYICYKDVENTRNFGFGVCHSNDYGATHWHVAEYAEFGIDIASGEYDSVGVSQLSVDIVDGVKKKLIEGWKNDVKNQTENAGIQLENTQIDALTAIMYQYGNIGNFTSAYQSYGDSEEFRNNFVVNGYLPFVDGWEGDGLRANANWTLFHEGKYITSDGEQLVASDFSDYSNETVSSIIEMAKSKLGCQYVWGSHGPDTFDCTGFVEWLFRQQGITVPWYTEAYREYTQYEISMDELQPGDVVMIYNTEASGGVGHAGIYIGNDEFIHCSGNVHISSLSERQNGHPNAFRHAFRFWE